MRTAKTEWLKWALSVVESQKPLDPQFSPTRRNFLKHTSKSALAFAVAPIFGTGVLGLNKPRIAIIGGGLAGMTCAWRLKKAGLEPIVYEATDRIGGRTMTIENFHPDGKNCEIGGEYFTSDHIYMIRMARELSLKVQTVSAPNKHLKPFKAYFGKKEIPLEELGRSLSLLADQINEDIASLPKFLSWEYADEFVHLDQMSISDYLRSKGADDLAYGFLNRAFTIENGMEANEQSALNLLRTFSSGFVYHPSSKIRSLQIKQGNQSICKELSSRLWKNIQTDHRLENFHQHTDWYKLTFRHQGRMKTVEADYVVMAVPFSVLRQIEHDVHFNDRKQLAINELGYGQKGSLLLGFDQKPWREQGYDGLTFSDEMFGYGSDLAPRHKGKSHVLSVKPSGKEAASFARLDTADAALKCLQSFDKIYPGISNHFDGQALKFCWSDNPNFLGSNSCYQVGQYSQFGGEEGKSVENMYFIGEHCSHDYKGTMNGAIETGDMAASNIIRRVERRKRKRRP